MRNLSIKISSVYNLTDARYFAAGDVTYMGFCIDEDKPEYCPPNKIQEIISWLEGPTYVLEVNSHLSLSNLPEISARTGIHHVHLGDHIKIHETLPGITYFKDFILENGAFQDKNSIHYPVIKSYKNIPEIKNDYLYLLQELCSFAPCFLDLPWTNPEDVLDIFQSSGAQGIILHGGDEEKTGLKNFEWMDDLFELIQS